ncbi:MAG: Transcriptional regulator, AraC family [Proteobacteria bacterium]|nr:Transcriptional regulator, AraC family [Pseudomonadota bacterium]
MINPFRATVSARIAAIILKGSEAKGVEPSELARGSGFDLALLGDVDARIPLEMENTLWNMAAFRTNDDSFGLHVAELIRPGMFDVLDYVVRTAPTLYIALQRLARYNRLMHDVAEFSLTEHTDTIQVDHYFCTPNQTAVRHAAEFTMAALLVIASQMSGKQPVVLAASFSHASPEDITEFRRIFGVTPQFGTSTNSLILARESVMESVPDADPTLSRIVTSHADQLLAVLEKANPSTLLNQVSHLILKHMSEGKVSLAFVAKELCFSERSLQRALQMEGTTFNGLFEDLRRRTAHDFISDKHLALGEVAFLLGFSEPSAFHRAFKRWTGQTPSQVRQSIRAKG